MPERKLISKGIASVQSRVINLKELCPALTVERLCGSLREAFSEVYQCDTADTGMPDTTQIREDAAWFASREWLSGTKTSFTHELEGDFAWGGTQVLLQVGEGKIADCRIHSDAMDQGEIVLCAAARGACRYERRAVLDRRGRLMAQQTGAERLERL